jgi:hypothetical protein
LEPFAAVLAAERQRQRLGETDVEILAEVGVD